MSLSGSRSKHFCTVTSADYSLSFFIFDEAGNAVAMLQNYSTFHLNAYDEIVGTGEAYVCEPGGDNCVDTNTSITFTGKRMNAQHP